MSERKNDILEEQRRARQQFLELKKMQQGEMVPEPKPSEIALEPKTFNEKIKNYWYHFKWHTIAVVFMAVVITVLTVQCVNREKYDFKVVYFGYKAVLDARLESAEDYLETFATDIDGDGNVNVMIINCSFEENSNVSYRNTVLTKLQSMIAAGDDTIMYIVDSKAEKYLNDIAEGNFFEKEPKALSETFYEKTKDAQFGTLPEGLKIANRKVSGTMLEKNKNAKSVLNECVKVLEEIK